MFTTINNIYFRHGLSARLLCNLFYNLASQHIVNVFLWNLLQRTNKLPLRISHKVWYRVRLDRLERFVIKKCASNK